MLHFLHLHCFGCYPSWATEYSEVKFRPYRLSWVATPTFSLVRVVLLHHQPDASSMCLSGILTGNCCIQRSAAYIIRISMV
jgi:hypothetical protein